MNFYNDPTFRRLSHKYQPKSAIPKPPALSIEDFDVLETIGRGGFGTVYKARIRTQLRRRGKAGFIEEAARRGIKTVALKVVSKSKVQSESLQFRLSTEILIHRVMKHGGIAEMFDFFEDEDSVYLIQEYCSGGDLWKYLKARSQVRQNGGSMALSEEETRGVMLQVGRAVLYMHKEGVLHRDLKLTNLLVTEDMEVRVTDFGLATKIGGRHGDVASSADEGDPMTVCGTVNYMSPEIMANEAYGFASDVWALGCLFVTLLTGKSPFDKFKQQHQEGMNGRMGARNYHDALSKIRFPADVSDEAIDLASMLLQVEPSKRISTKDLLAHPFFSPVMPTKALRVLSSGTRNSTYEDKISSDSEAGYRGLTRERRGIAKLDNYEGRGHMAGNPGRPPVHPSAPRRNVDKVPNHRNGLSSDTRRLVPSRQRTAGAGYGSNSIGSRAASRQPDTAITSVPLESTTMANPARVGSTRRAGSGKGGNGEGDIVGHFTTKRLSPRKHKQENMRFEIMADGRVLLEVAGDRYVTVVDPNINNGDGNMHGPEGPSAGSASVCLFPRGTVIFEPRKAVKVFDMTDLLLYHQEEEQQQQQLEGHRGKRVPIGLTKKVKCVVRFVEKIRSKTRRVILQTPQGQATLMENLPTADFHFAFLNDIRVSYLRRKGVAEVSIPSQQDLPNEIHRIPLPTGAGGMAGNSERRTGRMGKILGHVEEALAKCLDISKMLDQWEASLSGDVGDTAADEDDVSIVARGDYSGKIKYPVFVKWEQELAGFVPPGLVKNRRSVESRVLLDVTAPKVSGSKGSRRGHYMQGLGIDDDDDGGDEQSARASRPLAHLSSARGSWQQQQQHDNSKSKSSDNNDSETLFHAQGRRGIADRMGGPSRRLEQTHSQDLVKPMYSTPPNRTAHARDSGVAVMPAIVAGTSDRFQFIPSVGWCIYRPITDSNHTRYLVTPRRNGNNRQQQQFPGLRSGEDHEFIMLFNDGVMMVVDSTRKYVGWWDQCCDADSGIPEQQFHVDDLNLPLLVYRKFECLQQFVDLLDL